MSRNSIVENKACSLLGSEDNEQLFALIGTRCLTLASTVIQLYTSEPPQHLQWVKIDTGILCFVKDNIRKNYFFRLYCLDRNVLIWEQEIYSNMEYIGSRDFLHTFEGEGCMLAFNFLNVVEAKEFKAVVDHKLLIKKRREERRNNLRIRPEQTPHVPTNNDLMIPKQTTGKGKTKRKPLTKADIGTPSQFKHVTHIGFDPNKGFDVNSEDPHMNVFFQQAGVSQKHLQDKDTRDFIYDFIDKHGGQEAVKEVVQKAPITATTGPRVPSRTRSRAAPRPPPNATPPTPETSVPASNSGFIPPPPPPAPGIAPPPPGVAPPPPPPPPLQFVDAPITNKAPEPVPNMQSALLESIREGTTLKPVEVGAESSIDSPRGDLLSEIRKGFHLKPAAEREVKPVSPPSQKGGGDLASALARALAERNRVIQSEDDSSTSDSDANEEEWDA